MLYQLSYCPLRGYQGTVKASPATQAVDGRGQRA
jgi:hypothetical protein